MADNDGLSDEEYDALLADLEGRAAEGGGSEADFDDDQDLEDFLGSVEAEAESKTKTAEASRKKDDDLEAAFADLEPKKEVAKKGKKKKGKKKKGDKKAKKAKKKEKGGDSKGGAQDQRGKRIALGVAKNVAWVVPAVIFGWVLGAFLGHWVSAGWLIALVVLGTVLGVPKILYKVTERGSYRLWVGAMAAVLTLALVVPMNERAATSMGFYGHWPATAVAEITGAEGDAGFVETQGRLGGWVGSLVSGEDSATARQLGTVFPLGFTLPEDVLMDVMEDAEGGAEQIQEGLEGMSDEAEDLGEAIEEGVEAAEEEL